MRTALGVIAGYVLFAFSTLAVFLLGGHDPQAAALATSFLLARTAFTVVFAAAGGLLAGRIAAGRHRVAALCLALAIAAGAVVSIQERPDYGSTLSQLGVLLLGAPAAVVGDWLGTAWTGRRETGREPHS